MNNNILFARIIPFDGNLEEWLEKNVRSDLRQESTSYSEREGVQGGSETSNVVWVGDSGTDEKTGGGDGGGRVEDVAIFIRGDNNVQDQESVHQRDSPGGKFGEKTREARLRWYGHLRRKDDGYIGRGMLMMDLPGKRKRGRPKRRFMDVVKEDMGEVEVTEEGKSAVATPDGKSRKKKKTAI